MGTMQNGRTITAHEATIKTASVDVKALTISGRQVTLSVFRQLINSPLIDEQTGKFNGNPWGTVNYFWGDCSPSDHYHVVWQEGNEIRRTCARKRFSDTAKYRKLDHSLDQLKLALVSALVLSAAPDKDHPVAALLESKEYPPRLNVYGWNVTLYETEHRSAVTSYLQFGRYHQYRYEGKSDEQHEADLKTALSKAREPLMRHASRIAGTTDHSEIADLIRSADSSLRLIGNEWASRIAEIEALDQLFIAV